MLQIINFKLLYCALTDPTINYSESFNKRFVRFQSFTNGQIEISTHRFAHMLRLMYLAPLQNFTEICGIRARSLCRRLCPRRPEIPTSGPAFADAPVFFSPPSTSLKG